MWKVACFRGGVFENLLNSKGVISKMKFGNAFSSWKNWQDFTNNDKISPNLQSEYPKISWIQRRVIHPPVSCFRIYDFSCVCVCVRSFVSLWASNFFRFDVRTQSNAHCLHTTSFVIYRFWQRIAFVQIQHFISTIFVLHDMGTAQFVGLFEVWDEWEKRVLSFDKLFKSHKVQLLPGNVELLKYIASWQVKCITDECYYYGNEYLTLDDHCLNCPVVRH